MTPSEVPDGSIVITPKEFYDGVKADISDIKAAVSPLPQMKNMVDEHERRLAAVERRIWMATGFAAAAGVGMGGVLGQLLGQ